MKTYIKTILFISFISIIAYSSFAQEIDLSRDSIINKKIEVSIYIDHPIFFQHWGSLFLLDVEILLRNDIRFINPAFNVGFGLEFSNLGVETFAIPFQCNLLWGKSNYQFETGVGLLIVSPDVALTSRIGLRAYFFDHLIMRIGYTPYFFVPYGEREEGKPYIDTENDFSFSIGYTF